MDLFLADSPTYNIIVRGNGSGLFGFDEGTIGYAISFYDFGELEIIKLNRWMSHKSSLLRSYLNLPVYIIYFREYSEVSLFVQICGRLVKIQTK